MLEVSAVIDCLGFPHTLVVDGLRLRAVDHEDEKAQVFDALTGPSPCLQAVAAWDQLVHSFDDNPPADKPSFELVWTLIPDPEDADGYDSHLAQVRLKPALYDQAITLLKTQGQAADLPHFEQARKAAVDHVALLDLPENLRCAAALTWIGHALDGGVVRDPVRARRLRIAVDECWAGFAVEGRPSAAARKRLVWDARAHGWGPPS